MSKTNEVAQALEELVSCAEGMISAVNAIRELLSSEKALPAEPAETESVEEKTYEYIDVRRACSEKSGNNHTAAVKALIAKYGAEKLSDVKESDYPALMRDLEEIR